VQEKKCGKKKNKGLPLRKQKKKKPLKKKNPFSFLLTFFNMRVIFKLIKLTTFSSASSSSFCQKSKKEDLKVSPIMTILISALLI